MECPHCHAPILANLDTCSECGAALTAEAGKDQGVYPELAQANLLRMRGDTRGAESQLLSLLKRYPNNATAHEMLGDIYFESHEDGQAAQWYELALDLAPDTPGLGNKLERAKERLIQDEEIATVEQIGLQPAGKGKTWVGVAVAIVVLAVVAAGTLAFINRNKPSEVVKSVIEAPPQVTLEGTASPTATPSPTNMATSPTPIPSESPSLVAQDQAALTLLTQSAPDGSRLTALTSDPRTQLIQMTFSTRTDENPRPIAARLAKAAFDQYPGCATVTVRGSLEGKVVYVADGIRSRLEETQLPEWQRANPGEEAWQTHLLTNEWVDPGFTIPAAPSPGASAATSTSGIVPVNPP